MHGLDVLHVADRDGSRRLGHFVHTGLVHDLEGQDPAPRHLVGDLRRAGQKRGLLDEVFRRLADDALAERDDLAESLAQMRRGAGRVVRPAPSRS